MAAYQRDLQDRGHRVEVLRHLPNTGDALARLPASVARVAVVDPDDDYLDRRLTRAARDRRLSLDRFSAPGFLLTPEEIDQYGAEHPQLHMAEFYRHQRRRFNTLLDDEGKPIGGSWSFDAENRKKIPRSHTPPPPMRHVHGPEARSVAQELGLELPPYPINRDDSLRWLDEFMAERLALFGDYEDAMDQRDDRWYHGVLTPMLNTGLLTPREVLDRALDLHDSVPLNALEGFVRQVLGWREFMRLTYRLRGREMRTRNFWGHHNPMPAAFYRGDTGLAPFDRVVAKTQRSAWAHHIERLMVAGNLMLLCEIDPDAVYRWFMELYIDAYDWVMVPNVYAMSQYAAGGQITTKPYISGSNYLRKMSDESPGPWQDVWDGLYWRFIDHHREFFSGNARLALMPRQLDRMKSERRQRIFATADDFLSGLW
jgi:deoxyribodipyrimidine photolyase-related protein